jgi:hypothetical protein
MEITQSTREKLPLDGHDAARGPASGWIAMLQGAHPPELEQNSQSAQEWEGVLW